MAIECERKFRVVGEEWRSAAPVDIRQGYLSLDPERIVRVRVAGTQAFLTVKGRSVGISREEFEYGIPRGDGDAMLRLCGNRVVEKRRHPVWVGEYRWDVDEFLGHNAGLVVAEIELEFEEAPFPRPAWLGAEVTGDPRYYNAALAITPFCRWPEGGGIG